MSLISHVYDLLQVSNQPSIVQCLKCGRKNSDSQTEKTQGIEILHHRNPKYPVVVFVTSTGVYQLQIMVHMQFTKAT